LRADSYQRHLVAARTSEPSTRRRTHAAIERWIDAQKLETRGAPWETYVSDPVHVPDPTKWETEVVYPLR
jgi:effector-binding domain-containing protein